MTISGAMLKTTLGGLGLPPSWFASCMDVTMRTVVRWFDGDSIHPDVEEELELLCNRTLTEMRRMLKAVDTSNGKVALRTYRTDEEFRSEWPASWHRQLTFRVMEHLRAQGKTVTVEYR